jgi:hypothetical protein
MQFADLKNGEALYMIFQNEDKRAVLSLLNSLLFPVQENQLVEITDAFSSLHYFFDIKGAFSFHYRVDALTIEGNRVYIEFHVHFLNKKSNSLDFDINHSFQTQVLDLETASAKFPIYYVGLFSFSIENQANVFSTKHYQGPILSNSVNLTFIDLTKFNKTPTLLENPSDWWLYFFKNGLEKIDTPINDSGLDMLYTLLDFSNFAAYQLEEYEKYQERIELFQKGNQQHQKNQSISRELTVPFPIQGSAKLNLLTFEKKMGYYPPKPIDPRMFDLSCVESNLPSFAFRLFKNWTAQAVKHHPEIDFSILNEQPLIKNLDQALRESIARFFIDENYMEVGFEASAEWRHTLFLLKLSVALSRIWFFEYIHKRQNVYKTLIGLIVLKDYLADEKVRGLQVNQAYQDLLSATINLQEINFSLDFRKDQSSTNLAEANYAKENDCIAEILETLCDDYLKRVNDYSANFWVDNIESVFSKSLVNKLLTNNVSFYEGSI